MSQVRNFIWILPFIGSILTAISLFTPAVLFPPSYLQYMDGFYLIFGGGTPIIGFLPYPGVLIIGIISTILLTVCTIILFISSLTHRGKETPGSWIALAILLIGGTIFYIAGSEAAFYIYTMIHYMMPGSFWQGGIPSFSVIAPFIGGGLSLLGYIIGKAKGEEETEIKPLPKEEPTPSEEVVAPAPISAEEAPGINFCPVCGEKIPDLDAKYCPGCGTDLKSL
ncbi:MAG: zinc ribbon domain-containing protein [Promethearchaeota archaeon]